MIGEPAADDLRVVMCEAFRYLYLKGLITPLAGNASARISERYALITPSRKIKFLLRPSDIALIDIETGRLLEGPKPSSEYRMHVAIYRCRSDVKAVIHVHGVYAPILARELAEEPPMDTEGRRMGLRICFVPEVEPGSEELANAVAERVCRDGCDAIVLENHGIVAVGKSFSEALEIAELIEVYARRLLAKKLIAIGVGIG